LKMTLNAPRKDFENGQFFTPKRVTRNNNNNNNNNKLNLYSAL